MFKVVANGVFLNSAPMPNIAKRSPKLAKAIATPGAPFTFIVTWLIPGPPHYTVVLVFARAVPEGVDPKVCSSLILQMWLFGSWTNRRFPYVIVFAPVRQAVPQLCHR